MFARGSSPGGRMAALAESCRLSAASLREEGRWVVGQRRSHSVAGELLPTPSSPVQANLARPFDEVPGHWKNGWANLYRFWKQDGFQNMHNLMTKNFQTFGPIYREKIGYYESVNVILPEDAAAIFKVEGCFPERLTVQPWVAYRDFRNKKYGVLLKSGEDWRSNRLVLNREVLALNVIEQFLPLLTEVGEDFVKRVHHQIERSGRGRWTADMSNELFRYALESVSYILYGERLGLLQDYIDPEVQRFIDAVTIMFQTTSPMLYIPPELLRRLNSKIWKDHIEAWDVIFTQADKCIQNIYRDLRLNQGNKKEYIGVLATLLLQNKLHIDDIKASVTELMAGGVDTTSMTLQWTMYELARYPMVQDKLRAEVLAAKAAAQGDLSKVLKSVPLVRAAIKETLRLHPVAVSLQRYIRQETVIQNYLIPSGTLVQVGLYAMGRDSTVFKRPEKYSPERWLQKDNNHFRALSFGFGPRQCLGRRIAEMEMHLFLIHLLENFRIEVKREAEVKTTFDLILVPSKPIQLTLLPLE
ncbi:cholesterol side-chain cleavage enzyme, mitochondrial [Ambystoma mexicanum]|uniref:cholesterol side-chain cleavage enzyme, mitochondrial n=1 Tax=Ambystoma mexicanum TaxID=8296 RepID=UPI0037E723BD